MDRRTETLNRLSALFTSNRSKIESNSSELINRFRPRAMEEFLKLGVPDKKNESYKYTDLGSWFNSRYSSYFLPQSSDFKAAEKFSCDVHDLDSYDLVLLNGFYPKKNGSLSELPDGVWVGSLAEASVKFGDLVDKHYAKYAVNVKDGLIPFNTALAFDGVFIHVPQGMVIDKPVQIINLVHSNQDILVQHRNLIVVEDNADISMIVCDHALSPQKFLTNAVTEVYVGANARFDMLRVQNEHNNAAKLTHTFIHQERDSFASSNNITLHGGLVRNSTYHRLCGQGADCQAIGLYLADRWQHVDNFVSIDHTCPDCTSNQLFKGVLDDFATGVFNGKIYVNKGAQKTRAYQKNNSILLSDDARMDTKPHLEIYADDVKCSHGATIGQLDEDAMFYLRSRGINKDEAKLMLMFGFAHEVIEKIKFPALRDRIDNLVLQRLRGELTRCATCSVKCDK
ncbi:MAG TPA: Fe-S cluster assembly protein SufD [Bacteroidales bacterium]|nr:Fe-S cluster assembly protein SufD [Bacteroidales bacterium]